MKTVEYLLTHVDELLLKRQFFRGSSTFAPDNIYDGEECSVVQTRPATTPNIEKKIVSQERFAKELDPTSHSVIFDENIPSICTKRQDGSYMEIQFNRMGLPIQERIREKKTLHLCGNRTIHTMRGASPTDTDVKNFNTIKEYWEDRNMDGWRTKAVHTQLGYGNAALLFYYNRKGEIRCRLLSYKDGYTIISHNDDNGERLLECVYYVDEYNATRIDCYDDTHVYHLSIGEDGEWQRTTEVHGFSEIPMVTKWGDVAWNNVQSLIDTYEILYNLFVVIQKRHGWGILYIKGRFNDEAKKIAGSIILNDRSLDGNGSAQFLTPPSPTGTIDTLQAIMEQIQIGSSTTFLLPKDVKTGGDISALAIMLTQSLDIEGAEQGVIDWQNFISKMQRLFVEGLAKELVRKGENPNAITEFKKLRLNASMKIWRPFNEYEYNQMIATLKSNGILSKKTAIEKNTLSAPDEFSRVEKEESAAQQIVNTVITE